MSKITKKQLQQSVDLLDKENSSQHDYLMRIKRALKSIDIDILSDEFDEPKPQLKQLDQSVFDHPYATDRFKYVALNADGQAVFFESKPVISNCLDIWVVHTGSVMPMLKGYDASNWQNSLIERDTSKELTGSELCKAMLARGDKFILCGVSDSDDSDAENHEDDDFLAEAVTDFDDKDGLFGTTSMRWIYAVPINNQGEPLTASEVDL